MDERWAVDLLDEVGDNCGFYDLPVLVEVLLLELVGGWVGGLEIEDF